MARYEVFIKATAGTTIIIEADDADEAGALAQEAAYDAFQEADFSDYEVEEVVRLEDDEEEVLESVPASPAWLRHWIGVLADMPNRSESQEKALAEYRAELTQIQAAGQDN